jgi:predicted RNA polymerase sigma factor
MNHSPIVALNRVWAFSKVYGNAHAIEEAKKLKLDTNHFYLVLLAELYKQINTYNSKKCLTRALYLCKTDTEKEMIQKKITELTKKTIV